MKTKYGNWVPSGMIYGFLIVGIIAFVLSCIIKIKIINILLTIASIILIGASIWLYYLHSLFSYSGKRQLSKKIIEGIAKYSIIPTGGIGLDVGCGSGALTIACAKKHPDSKMLGIDRWGLEYYEYNKKICEDNALAEGADNVSFKKGDACNLPFEDESFDFVTSNYVYHNITGKNKQELLLETLRTLKKGGYFAIHDLMSKSRYGDMEAFVKKLKDSGYEDVRLIDTANGMFINKKEAILTDLFGSTLLVGRK